MLPDRGRNGSNWARFWNFCRSVVLNHSFGLGGGSSRAVTTSLKPIRLCDPSQNGLFEDCPQRHSEIVVRPASPKAAPTGSRISNSPSMRIGPLLATVTLVGMKGMVAWGGCWSDKTPVTPLRTRRRNRIRPSARADCRCVAGYFFFGGVVVDGGVVGGP